jgi:hypothetical protein
MDQNLVDTACYVTAMLERLSADSIWAHRASGLRGSLFKSLEKIESGGQPSSSTMSELARLVSMGFDILEKAAREIRADDSNK